MSLATTSSTGLSCCNDLGVSFVSPSNTRQRGRYPPFAPTNSPMNPTPPPPQPPPPPPRPIHLGPLPQLPHENPVCEPRAHHCLSRPACVGRESPTPYDFPATSQAIDVINDADNLATPTTAAAASDKRSSFLRRLHNWGRKFRLRTK